MNIFYYLLIFYRIEFELISQSLDLSGNENVTNKILRERSFPIPPLSFILHHSYVQPEERIHLIQIGN